MDSRSVLDKFLNDQEKAALQSFIENRTMFQAVRKVLLFEIYNNGTLKPGEDPDPARNFALSIVSRYGDSVTDDHLGRTLRGMYEGIQFVENALDVIGKLKQEKVVAKDNKNPAR